MPQPKWGCGWTKLKSRFFKTSPARWWDDSHFLCLPTHCKMVGRVSFHIEQCIGAINSFLNIRRCKKILVSFRTTFVFKQKNVSWRWFLTRKTLTFTRNTSRNATASSACQGWCNHSIDAKLLESNSINKFSTAFSCLTFGDVNATWSFGQTFEASWRSNRVLGGGWLLWRCFFQFFYTPKHWGRVIQFWQTCIFV